MRETGRYGVEAHLKKQVAAAGGATRKFVSPGHPGVPDQIVIWKRVALNTPFGVHYWAEVHWAETKAPHKTPRPGQAREHKRLRALGCLVYVLDTKAKVDEYVEGNR